MAHYKFLADFVVVIHAAYVAFGRAMGYWMGSWQDVHGAGAQRSDPKTGPGGIGHGPQGDARRVLNYVRCVRDAASASLPSRAEIGTICSNRLLSPYFSSSGRSFGLSMRSILLRATTMGTSAALA